MSNWFGGGSDNAIKRLREEQYIWKQRNVWRILEDSKCAVVKKHPDARCLFLESGASIELHCFDSIGNKTLYKETYIIERNT